MNKIQKETLTGLMLGDGFLEKHKNGLNANLKITRAFKDKKYLLSNANVFAEYNPKCVDFEYFDKRTNKTYYRSVLRTSVHPDFTKLHNIWYPNGKKIVPNNIVLTPKTLAIWFADDGSVYINSGHYQAKLATHGFSFAEVNFLHDKLKSLGLDPTIYEEKSGKKQAWFIMFANKHKVKSFVKIIDPVFPESMSRKSNIWRNSKKLFEEKKYPSCIRCNSDFVHKGGEPNRYICQNCGKSFKSQYIKPIILKTVKNRIQNLWATGNFKKKVDVARKLNISTSTVYSVLRDI